MKIRPATTADVKPMVALVNDYAEQGLMLHRSLAETYEHLRDFHVAEDREGQIVGLSGLRIMWANLAEVYSLAVAQSARGRGLGRALVEAMVTEAERLQIRQLFSLTYERAFFERLGFHVVDRKSLPLKVWSECVRCPKLEQCDEIAMVRELAHVADHGQRLPSTAEAESEYDAPMPRPIPAVLRIDRAASESADAAASRNDR